MLSELSIIKKYQKEGLKSVRIASNLKKVLKGGMSKAHRAKRFWGPTFS